MGSTLKKITIDELEVGLFIVEMDISWIKSPFLLHRRAIKTKNDIILLKKAGVKCLTIDLNKSQLIETENDSSGSDIKDNLENDPIIAESSPMQTQEAGVSNSQKLDEPSVLLSEEINRATILKKQANESFQQINEAVKSNQAISIEKISPVIDETVSSLLRNSQALLTLMNLKRYEEKLFSHSFSVMTLALTLAIKDGVEDEDLKILGMAALLHDIGWAQLPLNLFGQNRKYSDNELKVVRQHLKISNVIVSRSDDIHERSKRLILLHHERSDGSGYPDGLTQGQLDPLARILILADYYDEMIHGLLDKPGLISAEALKFLYKESIQKKLDKYYVEMLIKLLGIYPLCSAVELTSKEKGVVIEVARDKPLEPVVRILYSSDGNALAEPSIINLQKDDKSRQIKSVINCLDENVDPHNLLVMAQA
ncbi:MAG: DUF3391 domain-containing protein [gamma proteobacterium symbiont of Taylorina sp.]|nr:DUF3391 domain-containing protein [gamma proteobacterium symbiont of Taylorina sp.]